MTASSLVEACYLVLIRAVIGIVELEVGPQPVQEPENRLYLKRHAWNADSIQSE